MTTPIKLYYDDVFLNNELRYNEEKHTYTYKNKELTSVTTFVKSFFEPFDEDYISNIVASKRGVTQEEILKEWKEKREFGSKVHKEIEDFINKENVEGLSDKAQQGIDYYELHKKINNTYIDYPELRVYSRKHGLAGTIDLLSISEGGSVYLTDWKVVGSINKTAYQDKKSKYLPVQDCNYIHYVLQLNTYAYILKEEFGIDVSEMTLVHIGKEGNKVYNIPFCFGLIKEMLKLYDEVKNDE